MTADITAALTRDLSHALAIETSDRTLEKLKAIRQTLMKISCLEPTVPTDLTPEQRQSVQAALLWLNDLSEYQTLGICAETLEEAEASVKRYVAALSHPIQLDLPEQTGAVFLKFNTLKNAWYLDGYTGNSRGVLVSYHTSEPKLADVNGTYGPFPFDLF